MDFVAAFVTRQRNVFEPSVIRSLRRRGLRVEPDKGGIGLRPHLSLPGHKQGFPVSVIGKQFGQRRAGSLRRGIPTHRPQAHAPDQHGGYSPAGQRMAQIAAEETPAPASIPRLIRLKLPKRFELDLLLAYTQEGHKQLAVGFRSLKPGPKLFTVGSRQPAILILYK